MVQSLFLDGGETAAAKFDINNIHKLIRRQQGQGRRSRVDGEVFRLRADSSSWVLDIHEALATTHIMKKGFWIFLIDCARIQPAERQMIQTPRYM